MPPRSQLAAQLALTALVMLGLLVVIDDGSYVAAATAAGVSGFVGSVVPALVFRNRSES